MPDYKLSLSPELDRQLQKLARENDMDINQLLLNAVSVYKDLKENTSEGRKSVAILDKDDNPMFKVKLP